MCYTLYNSFAEVETESDTATDGLDFDGFSGTEVTFASGQATATVQIDILNPDCDYENGANERFLIRIPDPADPNDPNYQNEDIGTTCNIRSIYIKDDDG